MHQMGGFDTDAVRDGSGLTDSLTPVVALAMAADWHPLSDLLRPAEEREDQAR